MENLVGFCRRNFCVPVPRAESMEELNTMLLGGCERYLTHQICGKGADVGTMFKMDCEALFLCRPIDSIQPNEPRQR